MTSIEKLEVISGEQMSLLVKDTDFTARLEGAKLAIEVKPEAMPKLISGANARLTYTARGEHGLYSNTVSTFINDPTKEIGTSTKTARLGRVEVEKVDKETKKALAGAEFKVCLREAKAGADCQGIASFTTDERGKGVLNGLRAPGKYVLVETKAPAGYVLDPALRPFEFSGEEAEAAALTASFEVGNAKRSIPTLPLTGANGRLLMILMGICALFAALGLALLESAAPHSYPGPSDAGPRTPADALGRPFGLRCDAHRLGRHARVRVHSFPGAHRRRGSGPSSGRSDR